MQSSYDTHFVRDMGCTEAEWQGWLPAALGHHAWQRSGQAVSVDIAPGGHLALQWEPLPPRVLGLARLPRLKVTFTFTHLDATQRHTFMKRFDLYTQRGGG